MGQNRGFSDELLHHLADSRLNTDVARNNLAAKKLYDQAAAEYEAARFEMEQAEQRWMLMGAAGQRQRGGLLGRKGAVKQYGGFNREAIRENTDTDHHRTNRMIRGCLQQIAGLRERVGRVCKELDKAAAANVAAGVELLDVFTKNKGVSLWSS